jgi:hypothetical protein
MTISSEFETIIVCRPIIELRFKGGWATWLKKFSMEDDGELSRISAMSGHDIAGTEKAIQKLGLLPPVIVDNTYQYRDYYIYAMEYSPHSKDNLSIGCPDWLIWNEPLISRMSLFEIEKLPIEMLKTSPARPTFEFNHEAVIT